MLSNCAACESAHTGPGRERASHGPTWNWGKMGGSCSSGCTAVGCPQRGQPVRCRGHADGTMYEGRALIEGNTSVSVVCFLFQDWQLFTSDLWEPFVHITSFCVLPFRFIHRTGVVEAAGGCEIWRHGFLPATRSPGRQPQSSAGSGRSDEEQSRKLRSA